MTMCCVWVEMIIFNFTDKADPDWFNTFTQLAEDVSNKTMQDLWAKILAGEISQP